MTGDDASAAQVGRMSPSRWDTMYEQLVELKVIEKPFDPTTAYTLRFISSN